MHVLNERIRVLASDLGRIAPFFTGALNNLVINVSNVLHKRHIESAPHEIPPHDVERYKRTSITNMNVVIYRRTAYIHADTTHFNGFKIFLLTRLCVINLDHRIPLSLFFKQGNRLS